MSGVNGHGSPASGFGEASTPGASETDPSMEDILASIRRILSEDETLVEKPMPAPDEVFNLDESMLVAAPKHATARTVQPAPDAPAASTATSTLAEPAIIPEAPMISGNGDDRANNGMSAHAAVTNDAPSPALPMGPLVAPEATDAVTASMGALMRSLAVERQVAVYRGGPTLEDMVRDEMRPILKEWLDTNLPPLVERIVRAEIERVAQRAGG